MPGVLPIPAPYDAYTGNIRLLFRRFHKSFGKWPWELVHYFEPSSWSAMLVIGFTKLLKIDLPNTPDVDMKEVLNYLFEQSAFHRFPKYRNVLSNKVIIQAIEWLQDKRDKSLQAQHLTRSSARQRKRTYEIMKLKDGQKEGHSSHDNNGPVVSEHVAKKRLMLCCKFKSIKAKNQFKTVGNCITVEGDESDKIDAGSPGGFG
ncbi:hypothetical protein ACHAPU_010494 [Fusarium lateritium]